jgi:peptidoglycan/LPS O-acetylase OafA/YrhL
MASPARVTDIPFLGTREYADSSTAAWREFRGRKHFGNLDGLRCISILAVIWHHGPGMARSGFASRGFLGVPLFFAISGFLITTLLLREQQSTGGISLPKFYVRRSLRIFPLYYLVLGLYCLCAQSSATATGADFFYRNLPFYATYTSNWFVPATGLFAFGWSLAAEEQFYAAWPMTLKKLGIGRSTWLVGAMLAVVLAIKYSGVRTAAGSSPLWLVIPASVPMAILWGCLLAIAAHSEQGFRWLWGIFRYRWVAGIAGLAAVAAAGFLKSPEITSHLLFAALVAACVLLEDNALAPLLRHPWVVHLGMVSYGLYLLHNLMYSLVTMSTNHIPIHGPWNTPHSVARFVLTLSCSIALATVTYRLFESPLLQLRSRFAPQVPGAAK